MAAELIYTGCKIDALEAHRIGLVKRIVPDAELCAQAVEMAEGIARQALLTVQYSKQALRASQSLDLNVGIAHKSALFGACFTTKEQKEGMAHFLSKQSYNFAGE